MHSVLLGVVRFLLYIWSGSKRFKLRQNTVTLPAKCRILLSTLLETIDAPSEFKRKPRTIAELCRWKATEYRQFLLYTGMVVLKKTFKKAGMTTLYVHFLKLVCAMRILLSDTLLNSGDEHWKYARTLLHAFVKDAAELYGSKLFVYNIHSLLHLADEAGLYGNLDDISCFPFENYLGALKKLVRKPGYALTQIVRRLQELNEVADITDEAIGPSTVFIKAHTRGPIPAEFLASAKQYKSVVCNGIRYGLTAKDNCVMVGSKVGSIVNIIKQCNEAKVIVRFYRFVTKFFDDPLDSRRVGVARIRKELEPKAEVFELTDITKCYILPYDKRYRVVAAYTSQMH